MKTHIPDNCGNSPRSLLAIDIAVNLASNKYDELEPLLAEDFTLSIAGSGQVVSKTDLRSYMEELSQSKVSVDRFEVLTSISHGKYVAVSSRSFMSDGTISNSHDLYEFTGAGGSAKLWRVSLYTVSSKH